MRRQDARWRHREPDRPGRHRIADCIPNERGEAPPLVKCTPSVTV